MDARDQARFDMVGRSGGFGLANAADFTTPIPPAIVVSAGQTKARELFTLLNTPETGLIASIAANATAQQAGSGQFHGGTSSKATQRDAVMADLRGLNRTAAAIAEADNNAGLMEHFRMPHGLGQAQLAAKARAMVDKAASLSARFIELGHDESFAADIHARIKAYGQEDDDQNRGLEKQAGATGNFEPLLVEALKVVKQLDAIMHNIYKSNAARLGEWKAASHTERAPKRKQDEPPKPPTS